MHRRGKSAGCGCGCAGKGAGARGCIGAGRTTAVARYMRTRGAGIVTTSQYFDFPVGARAILSAPYYDYSGKQVAFYKKTSSGRWVTWPGQLEYFESFNVLVASRPVLRVELADGTPYWADGQLLNPPEPELPVPDLPEVIYPDDSPPDLIPVDEIPPLPRPSRPPRILRDMSGVWVGAVDPCNRPPSPFPSIDNSLDDADRHLVLVREAIDTARNCVGNIPPMDKTPSYCNLYVVPDWLDLAFQWADEAFCDCIDALDMARTEKERKRVVNKLIAVVQQALRELRKMIPVISSALSRAYKEGYDQGWIDGFASGYEEGQNDREDEWDALLDDLKGMVKVGLPILGVVIGGALLLGGAGWVYSKWK